MYLNPYSLIEYPINVEAELIGQLSSPLGSGDGQSMTSLYDARLGYIIDDVCIVYG